MLQSTNRSLDFIIIGQSGWLTADTEEGLMEKVPIDLSPKGWKQALQAEKRDGARVGSKILLVFSVFYVN